MAERNGPLWGLIRQGFEDFDSERSTTARIYDNITANPEVVFRALGWTIYPSEQDATGEWCEPYALFDVDPNAEWPVAPIVCAPNEHVGCVHAAPLWPERGGDG